MSRSVTFTASAFEVAEGKYQPPKKLYEHAKKSKNDSADVIHHQNNADYVPYDIEAEQFEDEISTWNTVTDKRKERQAKKRLQREKEREEQRVKDGQDDSGNNANGNGNGNGNGNENSSSNLLNIPDAVSGSGSGYSDAGSDIGSSVSHSHSSNELTIPAQQHQSSSSSTSTSQTPTKPNNISNNNNNSNLNVTPTKQQRPPPSESSNTTSPTTTTSSSSTTTATADMKQSLNDIQYKVINSAQDMIEVIRDSLNQLPDKSIKIEHIGDKICGITGQSWNKAYKKSYGSIRDFISKAVDDFVITEDDRIQLKPRETPPSATKNKKKKKKNKPSATTAAESADMNGITQEIKEDATQVKDAITSSVNKATAATSSTAFTDTIQQQASDAANKVQGKIKEQVPASVKQSMNHATQQAQRTLNVAKAKADKAAKKSKQAAMKQNGHIVNEEFDRVADEIQDVYYKNPQQYNNVAYAALAIVAVALGGVLIAKYLS